jgi:uncharacterized membrane protein YidH (DUF202 family)
MKAIVLILLAGIVISLGSGLFFLTRDEQDSTRMLKALKVRVALSVVLVVFLVSAFYFGWIS